VKIFFTVAGEDWADVETLFEGKHGRAFKNGGGEHPEAIEIHRSRRYFTVTGEAISATDELRPADVADLRWLVLEAGPKFAGNGKADDGASKDESRSARAFRAGAAIKAAGASYDEMRDDGPSRTKHWLAMSFRGKGKDSSHVPISLRPSACGELQRGGRPPGAQACAAGVVFIPARADCLDISVLPPRLTLRGGQVVRSRSERPPTRAGEGN
jgi:hypothetical protein